MSHDELSLCIDIGKSGSRGRLAGIGVDIAASSAGLEPETAGRPGAGDLLLGVVLGVWEDATRRVHEGLSPAQVGVVAVGSTSIPPGPEIEVFLDGATRVWPHARVVLVEDGVFGHAAALGGPGNFVSIGTGVIASGLDAAGTWFRRDGWGPDLGDRGSAVWLGRAGLTAALRAADDAGAETMLRDAADAYLGGLDHAAAARLAGRADRVAAIAAFARTVCATAETDDVARALVVDAAAEVASTVASLARDTGITEVAVGGRLIGEPAYRDALDAAFAGVGIRRLPIAVAPWEVSPDVLFSPAYAAAASAMRSSGGSSRPAVREPRAGEAEAAR
jgi:N-acetylglucosamine kinase-like BadF-type ATPase